SLPSALLATRLTRSSSSARPASNAWRNSGALLPGATRPRTAYNRARSRLSAFESRARATRAAASPARPSTRSIRRASSRSALARAENSLARCLAPGVNPGSASQSLISAGRALAVGTAADLALRATAHERFRAPTCLASSQRYGARLASLARGARATRAFGQRPRDRPLSPDPRPPLGQCAVSDPRPGSGDGSAIPPWLRRPEPRVAGGRRRDR